VQPKEAMNKASEPQDGTGKPTGNPRGLLKARRKSTFWKVMKQYGTSWNIMEHYGTLWKIMESPGKF